jgi:hypothetical protein
MGEDFHFTAAGVLEMMERSPWAVLSHAEACEPCRYLLALVRRASGEPSPEQSEVALDLLRRWSRF